MERRYGFHQPYKFKAIRIIAVAVTSSVGVTTIGSVEAHPSLRRIRRYDLA